MGQEDEVQDAEAQFRLQEGISRGDAEAVAQDVFEADGGASYVGREVTGAEARCYDEADAFCQDSAQWN